MHQKLFSRAPNAKLSLPWGNPLPDLPPARSLRSLADYFRRHGNIGYFQRRSLAKHYHDECIWNGMLKAWCYRLAPLLFGGNHILVIFAQNMHQKLFFRAPNAKFSLPWEGGTPPRPSPRSVASLHRKLLSETWKYRSFLEALAR